MGLATRGRTRAVLVLLAVVVAAAAWDTSRLLRAENVNRTILHGELPPELAADPAAPPPELRFVQAQALAKGSENGVGSADSEAALKLYRALQSDTPLGQAARYNSANLLMQQAMVVRAGNQPGQAIPLIELAKEIYREVLRVDPGHWDARYNLERAQRALPDPEENDNEPPAAPEAAERAATTMRGVSPGLP